MGLLSSVGTILRIIMSMVSFVGIESLLIVKVQILVVWSRLEDKWLGKSLLEVWKYNLEDSKERNYSSS